MTIYLPLTRHAPGEPDADGEKATRGAETILVVDDDPSVRRMTARVLETRGYRVLCAASGLEALQLLRTRREPVQLLLTDVVLADGMSGPLLAERVRLLRPEMKVLFLSGYSSDVTLEHGLRELGDAFVQKPFTADTLCTSVRKLMAAPRRRANYGRSSMMAFAAHRVGLPHERRRRHQLRRRHGPRRVQRGDQRRVVVHHAVLPPVARHSSAETIVRSWSVLALYWNDAR